MPPSHSSNIQHRRRIARQGLTLFLLLLAFGVRAWQLDAQSLWHDEGLSWWFARAPLLQTLKEVAGTEHPPLYFLTLGVWMRLAGDSAYALRFLSLIGGVLSVVVLLALGRRWRLYATAHVAAFFMALSPLHIWYSQEVRSYAWFSIVGLALAYLGWRWHTRGWPRDGWLYGAAAIMGLYIHTFTAFILAPHAGIFLVSAWRRRPRLVGMWRRLWPFGLVGLAFLPWLWPTLRQLGTNRTYWYWGYLDVPKVVQSTAQAFLYASLLESIRPVFVPRLTFLAWLLALVGSAYLWRRQEGKWTVVTMWAPLVLTLGMAYAVPKYAPRYVLDVQPLWFLLVAAGIMAVVHWVSSLDDPVVPCMAGTFLALLLAGYAVTAWEVRELTSDPRVARPDFRGPVTFVNEKAQPGDAVILVGGHIEAITRYYLRRPDVHLYPMPKGLLLDLGNPLRWDEVAPAFSRLTHQHSRVWTIFWQEDLADPQRLVYSLAQTYFCPVMMPGLTEGVDVGLYLVVKPLTLPVPPVPQHPIGIPFRNGLVLAGLDAARVFPPTASVDLCLQDRRNGNGIRVAAGETLYVVLYFQVTQPLPNDLTGFVHLVSPDGAKAYALADRLLGDFAYPAWRWQVGEIVRQEFPLQIPPETREGEYALEVGLYHPKTLQRVDPLPKQVPGARVDGSRILVGPVQVLPP